MARQLCLVYLGQEPLDLGKLQDRTNSEGLCGLGPDNYLVEVLGEELESPRQLSSVLQPFFFFFFLRMSLQKKGAPFIAGFPWEHQEAESLLLNWNLAISSVAVK